MKKAIWIVLALVVVFVLGGISVNNSLVGMEEETRQAWAQVENQYQRRADLIPNLVNTVRGASNFEQETLTAVIEARSRATSIQLSAEALKDPKALERFQEAQNQLSGALSRLMMTVEKYPELRANENYRDLMVQLEGTENRISTERNRFNKAAQTYNTKLRTFPTSLMAGILGFEKAAYFEAQKGAEQAPTVSF